MGAMVMFRHLTMVTVCLQAVLLMVGQTQCCVSLRSPSHRTTPHMVS